MLAVGTGLRSLRLYDVRKARESATDVDTRATSGICFDPFESTRMASYYHGENGNGNGNGIVEFWDTRKMPVPVLTIHMHAQAASLSESHDQEGGGGEGRGRLMQVAFSPRRRGLIGTLSAEARHVRLWTLMGPHPEAVSYSRGDGGDGDGSKDSTASPSGALNDGAHDYITAKNLSSTTAGEIPLVVGNVRNGERPELTHTRSLISGGLSY